MRAHQPSSTARLIARSILLSTRHPTYQRLVPPGAAACLTLILREGGRAAWFDVALRHPWAARWLWRAESILLPGIILHYLARKQWLEQAVIRFLHTAGRQVVVLGAGFDTLAWRLHRAWPDAQFCEIDHPATQRPKAAALAASNPGPNLTLQAADLGRELPVTVLRQQPAFDSRRRICFVAEGLLMYFPPERVASVLRDLAACPDATLAFTFMAPGADGRAAFRGSHPTVAAWLRLVREPFAWAIAPAALGEFLRGLGWRLESLAGATELRAEILARAGLGGAPLAEGEYLCTATVLP